MLGWSPPGASFTPTATQGLSLSSQQALKLSKKQHFSHLECSGRCMGKLLPARERAELGRAAGRARSRDPSPSRGTGKPVSALGGEGLGALPGSVPVQLWLEPSRWGRFAAVVACLASPHLSGIRCSVAGNSQRIPAPNCSRLSSFSQGLSRCVGDAG